MNDLIEVTNKGVIRLAEIRTVTLFQMAQV